MIQKGGISEGKEPICYIEADHEWKEAVRKFGSK